MCSYFSSLEFRCCLNFELLSLRPLIDLADTLGSLALDYLEVSLSYGQLTVHVLVLLHSLLCAYLLDDFQILVVTENSDLIFLLGLLILVHGAILSLLVEGLSYVFWQAYILEDDPCKLEALVLKHRVQEVEHLLGLVLTLDLVDLEIGLSAS